MILENFYKLGYKSIFLMLNSQNKSLKVNLFTLLQKPYHGRVSVTIFSTKSSLNTCRVSLQSSFSPKAFPLSRMKID